jgi:CubicO group peptidase (beta-lactamase class C family)
VGWASETARAAAETFDGAFPGERVVVAAAAVDADGTATALGDGCPPDGRFELGSVTKTMTGTLLASLAGDGLAGLDDEIGRWLAAGPNAGITLRQLATHTSGLPRLAPITRPPTTRPTPMPVTPPRSPKRASGRHPRSRARVSVTRTSATSCWAWRSNARPAVPTRRC